MAKDNKHATDELSTRGTAMKIDGVEEFCYITFQNIAICSVFGIEVF